jgi:3-deoxy-7-phosphoheptulonate synthase
MMIMMAPEATPEQIDNVVARLDLPGTVHAKVVPGETQVAVAAIGDAAAVRQLEMETVPGVDRVVPLSRPYKLAARELSHDGSSVVDVAGRRVGPETFSIIAGPCTVESPEQTLRVATEVAPHATMLRGGAFKPRTSPFAFRGLGPAALEILAEARARTGLPVVTELTDLQHADAVAAVADVIQVGARNMQNYALLEAVGRLGKPVLIKRGLSSTLEELLMAADYVLKEGNDRVILCERGIRTFETAMRFTLDLGAVPWLKLHTHLPVIVDPSHAAGDRRLVDALARGAAAVGADGIIVEVHGDPDTALCDGPQQLHARDFGGFAAGVLAHAALAGRRPSVGVAE